MLCTLKLQDMLGGDEEIATYKKVIANMGKCRCGLVRTLVRSSLPRVIDKER
jgi:hypothetical protein